MEDLWWVGVVALLVSIWSVWVAKQQAKEARASARAAEENAAAAQRSARATEESAAAAKRSADVAEKQLKLQQEQWETEQNAQQLSKNVKVQYIIEHSQPPAIALSTLYLRNLGQEDLYILKTVLLGKTVKPFKPDGHSPHSTHLIIRAGEQVPILKETLLPTLTPVELVWSEWATLRPYISSPQAGDLIVDFAHSKTNETWRWKGKVAVPLSGKLKVEKVKLRKLPT